MKKFLIVPFLLSFHFAFAGTGGGRDTVFFYLVIIEILSIIFVVIYSIGFFRRIIQDRKNKRNALSDDKPEGETMYNDVL